MSRVALASGHAREYETIYILRPNLEKDTADGIAGRLSEAITSRQGVLTDAELWGQRRLAYPIQSHHRGIYVYLKYLSRGDAVSEIERQLRLADGVIRYQTIQIRNDVDLTEAGVEQADLDLDFNVPREPDEPALSIERELGLDQAFAERSRRPRDDRGGPRGAHGDRDREPARASAEQPAAADRSGAAAPAAGAAPAGDDAAGKSAGSPTKSDGAPSKGPSKPKGEEK